MNVKIRNKFIEIKYNVSYRLVIFGRSAFIEIFYIKLACFKHFPPFSRKFDNIFLTIHNKMFRVGAKTKVGSGNLKHTHTYIYIYIFFFFFLPNV